jgi:hypothetical protein
MKLRIAALTILFFALTTTPAWAQSDWSYNNGPTNGDTDAWTINFGFIVSDTFVAGGTRVTDLVFETWLITGDVVTSLDWSITAQENGVCPGSGCYGYGTANGYCLLTMSGTGTCPNATSIITRWGNLNAYDYQLAAITIRTINVTGLVPGGTYWLNLQNAVTTFGDPVYWDENSGVGCTSPGCPSSASQNQVGTIPSETFTIFGSS